MGVAELDRILKQVVEKATLDVSVEGEISGLRVVSSGHAYFTLKDEREDAAIDAVMYRGAPARSRHILTDGARIVVRGHATVYMSRGRLQLVAESATLAGRGALLEALERLKEKLHAEGLFAEARKRPLPTHPKWIGVATSGDGAAIHDIAKVAFHRGSARIVLARTLVQGSLAPQSIVNALAQLQRLADIDVIILGRGGGSADDLAAYNDEAVARAVAACRVPVVSAVGHEIDVSLTDLVADARAATPSQAAELLVADEEAFREMLRHFSARMHRALERGLSDWRGDVARSVVSIRRMYDDVAALSQRNDELSMRLRAAMSRQLLQTRTMLERTHRRLAGRHPKAVVLAARAQLAPLRVRLGAGMRPHLSGSRRTLAESMARLEALSPLRVLSRGYAIATDASGRIVRDSRTLQRGDGFVLRVEHGSLCAAVTMADHEAQTGETNER